MKLNAEALQFKMQTKVIRVIMKAINTVQIVLKKVVVNSINFDNKKMTKSNSQEKKRLFKIDELNVNKTFVSKKELYDEKRSFNYDIGSNNNDGIRPLCIKLPQMAGYAKYFDSNRTMFFKFSDKKTVKKAY